ERTGARRVTPGNLAEAEAILIEALREQEDEFRISPTATRVRTAVRRLEFDLLRHLRTEADSGGTFEPAELELEFGREGSLQPAELDAELERARDRARELAGRMRAGEMRPCPKTCAWNGGCSYPSVCRVER